MTDPTTRLERARIALEGVSVGDALGGWFEFAGKNAMRRIAERRLPGPPWHWTDDTHMALAITAILQQYGGIDQDALAATLATRYERRRGYGMATRAVLARVRRGADWRVEAAGVFGGQGSYGNGAASRVPPLGAYFADDLEAAAAHAVRSAVVTHAHPEAQAGAIAVAVAAGVMWHRRDLPLTTRDLLAPVIHVTPPSAVRDGLIAARDLPTGTTASEAAAQLGNGNRVTCQDTVPFALWCAASQPDDFASAIWLTLSGLGDCDTTCAIVGGLVAARVGIAGIPTAWLQNREPLPEWPFAAE